MTGSMIIVRSSRAAGSPSASHDGPSATPDLAGVLAELIQSVGWGKAIAFLALLLAFHAAKGVIDIYLQKLEWRVNNPSDQPPAGRDPTRLHATGNDGVTVKNRYKRLRSNSPEDDGE